MSSLGFTMNLFIEVGVIFMKYTKEMYIDSGIYGLDEDIRNHQEKIVTCRKPHKCVFCDKDIAPGEQALSERGFTEDGAVSAYTCLDCIESWLEESGQIETETDEEEYLDSKEGV